MPERTFARDWRRAIAVFGFIVVATLAFNVSPAHSISRVNAGGLSCAALQDIVINRGAVIVKSRSPRTGNPLSDRYVAHRGFCFAYEITRIRTVATRDARRCPLRYCTEPLDDRDFRFPR